jgi:hypothetical protein
LRTLSRSFFRPPAGAMVDIKLKHKRGFKVACKRIAKVVLDGIISTVVQRGATPARAIAEERRLSIILTPHGHASGAASGEFSRSLPGCGCDGCSSAPASATLLLTAAVNKMKLAPNRLKELAAHGKVCTGNVAAQFAALKAVVAARGFYLTRISVTEAGLIVGARSDEADLVAGTPSSYSTIGWTSRSTP